MANPRIQPWLLYAAYVFISLILFFKLPSLPDLGDNYHGQALNILEGRGFSDPSIPKAREILPESSLLKWWEKYNISFGSTRPNQPTARCMPLYPLWLVLWFSLFGYLSPVVHVIQILFMGLTIPLVYYLGRRLFHDDRIAFLAGLILVLHPHFLRNPGSFPNENLFIPLFIAGVAAWFWIRERPTIKRLAVYSLVWALAGLTREMGIFYGLLSLILLLVATPQLRRYFFVPIMIMALLWTPWVYRNATVMGTARLFPTRSGYNLWLAYNRLYMNWFLDARNRQARYPMVYFIPPENEPLLKGTYGLTDAQIQEFRRYDYPMELMQANEVEIDRVLMQRALLFLRENPGVAVRFTFARLLDTFTSDLNNLGQRSLAGLNALYLLAFFIVGSVGFLRLLPDYKKYWYVLTLTLFFFFLLAIGPWGARYRQPIDPILALFAGGLIVWGWDRIFAGKDAETQRN